MMFFPSLSIGTPLSTHVQELYTQISSMEAVQRVRILYQNHSDLISSITNLTLNTLLLLSKLTQQRSSIIPRMANAGLGFSGLICLNMMVRDWAKHYRDCRFAWRFGNYGSLALATARVHVKAVNTLLLLTGSLNTLVGLLGYFNLQERVIRITTPIALIALMGTISGEFIDYACKSTLLGRLDKISKEGSSEEKVKMIAKHFLALAYHPPFDPMGKEIALDSPYREEQQLAIETVMQMEEWSLEMLKQDLSEQGLHIPAKDDNYQLVFDKVKTSLEMCQKNTRGKISLIAIGYIGMALCKAYPYTIIQYSINWSMSFLYTYQLAIKRMNYNCTNNRPLA